MRQGLRSEHLFYYLKYLSLLPIGRVHQRIFNHGNSVSRFKIVKNYSDKNVDERMEVDNIYYTIFSLCNTCIILYWASQLALVVKNPDVNSRGIRDMGLIPGLGRSPGGGHDHPLQYSCRENSMDRGAWWATVHRVPKSQTGLKQLRTHTLLYVIHVYIKMSKTTEVGPYLMPYTKK